MVAHAVWKTWPSGLSNEKTSAFGLGFCLLSPSGHVFHTAWETMIKSYIRVPSNTMSREIIGSESTRLQVM